MKIQIAEYLHRNTDSFAEWEIEQSELGNYDLNGAAARELHYMLYEVAFTVEVDLETGEYEILKVDGRTLLPKEQKR